MTRAKSTGVCGPRPGSSDSTRRHVAQVMRRMSAALRPMAEPAVGKIAEAEQADPFKVLVATMLSAQTRDPVTLEASNRLFARAGTPDEMVRLRVSTTEQLIYPVSFYRHKARHLKRIAFAIYSSPHGRYTPSIPLLLEKLVETLKTSYPLPTAHVQALFCFRVIAARIPARSLANWYGFNDFILA